MKSRYNISICVLLLINFVVYYIVGRTYDVGADGYLISKTVLIVNGIYLCLKLVQSVFDEK